MSGLGPGCVKTRRDRQTLQYSNQTCRERERLLPSRRTQRINLAARSAHDQFSHSLCQFRPSRHRPGTSAKGLKSRHMRTGRRCRRSAISRSVRPLRITHVARASPSRRKVESLSVLAALVAGQPILEPIIIGFVGDKDMGSELQNRRAIEGSGRDIDQRS